MVQRLPDIELVIFRMENVPFIDQSGLYALEDVVIDLKNRGVKVVLVGLQGQPKDLLQKVRFIPELVAEEEVFERFEELVKALPRYLKV